MSDHIVEFGNDEPVREFDDGYEEPSEFCKELQALINKYSMENDSNTPDFLLACFIEFQLKAIGHLVNSRDTWHGFDSEATFTYRPGVDP